MRKAKQAVWCVFWAALVCILCAGCEAGQILDEIPRDFVLSLQDVEEAAGGQEDVLPAESAAESAAEFAEEAEAPCFLMDEVFYYGYSCLSEAEQIWYRDIERILGEYKESENLSEEGLAAGLDESHIDRIFQYVMGDHPELFYVEGYSYTKYMLGEELISIDFSGTYSIDLDAALERGEEIKKAADEILAGVDKDATDYEKIKYVYETLIRQTDYSLDAPDDQNLYSVFVNHLSVCQGYAKATQYLANRLGVECTLVLGRVDTGEGHAWNLARIDGEYYYIDTTWGDVSYQVGDASSSKEVSNAPQINYDYLNVTTEELLRTHSLDGVLPMPNCCATAANYYVMEGALFASYDKEQLEALFEQSSESGQEAVAVKCADEAVFAQIKNALIDEQEIFRYLNIGEGSVAYAVNEKQLSMTFWVTNE